MSLIIDSFNQRSEEWYLARAGNPGSSSISKIITNSGEISKQRIDYLYQLAGESITGYCEESFQSQAMLDGIERENTSRSLFTMIYGVEVRQVGIVYKDEWKLYHCSPDGLVGENAILELKNPMLKTHVKYLFDGKLPSDYFGQCQMSLYVTERELCYFMSSYAGLPPLILEIKRDEPFISKLAKALDDFAAELILMVRKLEALK
ncbi:MAG: YqaJ viral recombinase family protein [Methanolobus sp.]|uniref:lambda exonuclease family protein n=1 Tax=Methanolobus sp. TaxID=1874737 RepID=UPI00272F9011|nr:lambda exonuclease family protein [Methanolobus sp.]MDP2218509.1 YqaJ viral recombinase family protein [Methanolobus sp.]